MNHTHTDSTHCKQCEWQDKLLCHHCGKMSVNVADVPTAVCQHCSKRIEGTDEQVGICGTCHRFYFLTDAQLLAREFACPYCK